MISYKLILLLLFCHYIADYTHLSTKYMLDAKRIGSPLHPIFLHAFVHAALMCAVIAFYGVSNLQLFSCIVLQLISHFIIDVVKGRLNIWFPIVSNPANKQHWYIFGLDQLLHQIVIVVMAYICSQ